MMHYCDMYCHVDWGMTCIILCYSVLISFVFCVYLALSKPVLSHWAFRSDVAKIPNCSWQQRKCFQWTGTILVAATSSKPVAFWLHFATFKGFPQLANLF